MTMHRKTHYEASHRGSIFNLLHKPTLLLCNAEAITSHTDHANFMVLFDLNNPGEQLYEIICRYFVGKLNLMLSFLQNLSAY